MRKKIIIISSISALVILASIGTLKIVLFNNEEKNSEEDIQSQAIVSTDETSSLLDENNNFDSKNLGLVTINSSETSTTESVKATATTETVVNTSKVSTTTTNENKRTENTNKAVESTEGQVTVVETTTEHSHSWVAVYKTVHHDATYKEEQYVVKEAWDEEVTEPWIGWIQMATPISTPKPI